MTLRKNPTLWNLTLGEHFMKFIFRKKYKLYIKFFQKIFFYAFNTIMKVFFTIVYIRIISLKWKFDDHPLVEYPLLKKLYHTQNYTVNYNFLNICRNFKGKFAHLFWTWILNMPGAHNFSFGENNIGTLKMRYSSFS